MEEKCESLVLGGGCFWCLEAIFERMRGVVKVESGYAGGETENPSYEEVCGGETGHAEVIRIHFDPAQVSLAELFDLFWKCHNPTTRDRQGADVGSQYRSIILYQSDEQKRAALESKSSAQSSFPHPIVTEISELGKFTVAEGRHQNYFNNNPNAPYCSFVIHPKLSKLGME